MAEGLYGNPTNRNESPRNDNFHGIGRLGMALGCLRLDDRVKSAGAIEVKAEDIRPLHG